MIALRFVFFPVLIAGFASAQIDSIFNSLTSDAGSVFTQATSAIVSVATDGASHITSVGGVITSAAGDVEEKVTSFGGSVFTIVTSDGGEAVTLGENGIGTAVTDVTKFYASATSVVGTAATGHSNGNVARLHDRWSLSLFASLGAVVGGVLFGAQMIL